MVPSAWHRETINKYLLSCSKLPALFLICAFFVSKSPRGILHGQNMTRIWTPVLIPSCLAQLQGSSRGDRCRNRWTSTLSGHHDLAPRCFHHPCNSTLACLIISSHSNKWKKLHRVNLLLGTAQWLTIAFITNSVPWAAKPCTTGPLATSPASPHSLSFWSFLHRMCYDTSCRGATAHGIFL